MARFLALEWDDSEARIVVASSHADLLTVEQALIAPLPPLETAAEHAVESGAGGESAEAGMTREARVGKAIGQALRGHAIGRVECLVAVGRTSIELKHLQLPPAPDDELPELVRFQALRDFNELGEDWPLDFISLAGSETEPRSVLAAAISPELVGQIEASCRAANLQPRRLVLRPCAAAALLRRTEPNIASQAVLLVDLLSDEADLTVMVDGTEVFLRTARLTSLAQVSENWRPLLVEIRRTMAAVSNQLGGRQVESVYLCGDGVQHAALAARIHGELKLPAFLLDPFAGIGLSPEVVAAPPEHPGRFAPLLGMLVSEAANVPPTIDFLHPRRRPEPPSYRRTWSLAATAAGCIALVTAYLLWSGMNARDNRIADLNSEIDRIDRAVNPGKAGKLTNKETVEYKVAGIDKWTTGDRVWLDELRELSEEFVKPQEGILTQLHASVTPQGSSFMELEGAVRDAATIDALEKSLRDPAHTVDMRASQEDDKLKHYPWVFKSTVTISDRPAALASGAPKAAPAATSRSAAVPAAKSEGT